MHTWRTCAVNARRFTPRFTKIYFDYAIEAELAS